MVSCAAAVPGVRQFGRHRVVLAGFGVRTYSMQIRSTRHHQLMWKLAAVTPTSRFTGRHHHSHIRSSRPSDRAHQLLEQSDRHPACRKDRSACSKPPVPLAAVAGAAEGVQASGRGRGRVRAYIEFEIRGTPTAGLVELHRRIRKPRCQLPHLARARRSPAGARVGYLAVIKTSSPRAHRAHAVPPQLLSPGRQAPAARSEHTDEGRLSRVAHLRAKTQQRRHLRMAAHVVRSTQQAAAFSGRTQSNSFFEAIDDRDRILSSTNC